MTTDSQTDRKLDAELAELCEQACARAGDDLDPATATRELLALIRAHRERVHLEEKLLWKGARAALQDYSHNGRFAALSSDFDDEQTAEALGAAKAAARQRAVDLGPVLAAQLHRGQNLYNFQIGFGRLGDCTKAALAKNLQVRLKASQTVAVRLAWLQSIEAGMKKPDEKVRDCYSNAALWKLYKAAQKSAAA